MDKSKKLETIFLIGGLILSGLAIAITGVSYLMNMTFTYQWLVCIHTTNPSFQKSSLGLCLHDVNQDEVS